MSDHATTFSGILWDLCSMTTLFLSLRYLAHFLALLQSCSSGFDVNLDTSFAANCMSVRSWHRSSPLAAAALSKLSQLPHDLALETPLTFKPPPAFACHSMAPKSLNEI